MASKSISRLTPEAKEELAREVAARWRMAREAASLIEEEGGFEMGESHFLGILASCLAGLSFVTEELHREADEVRVRARPVPPASGGLVPEPSGVLIVHKAGSGVTTRHNDTPELRGACPACRAKEAGA